MMDLAFVNDAIKNATNTAVKDAITKTVKDATKEAFVAEVEEWEKRNDKTLTKKIEDAWHRMAKAEFGKINMDMAGFAKKLKEKMSKDAGREFIKLELRSETSSASLTLRTAVDDSIRKRTSRWEDNFKTLQDKMSSLRVSLDTGLKNSRQRLDTQGKTIGELKKSSGPATSGKADQRIKALEKQLQEARQENSQMRQESVKTATTLISELKKSGPPTNAQNQRFKALEKELQEVRLEHSQFRLEHSAMSEVNQRFVEQHNKDAEEKKQLAEEIKKLKQGSARRDW